MQYIDLVLYIGTFVFALTGALKARTSSMDIFGALVSAFVTAYGGGTIRDLLIGIRPVNWINDYTPLLLVLGATLLAFVLRKDFPTLNKILFITDAVGLAMFTIGGIEVSRVHGINDVYCLVLGVISATFGGLVADVIGHNRPRLLMRGEIYATASAIGGIIYMAMGKFAVNQNIRLLLCVTLIVLIRYVSKWKQISLPNI